MMYNCSKEKSKQQPLVWLGWIQMYGREGGDYGAKGGGKVEGGGKVNDCKSDG